MQTSPDSFWSLHVVLSQARLCQVEVFELELEISSLVKVNCTSEIRILWPGCSSRIECSDSPRHIVLT